MTDFRELCAELVEALNTNDYYDERSDEMAYSGLLSRARAALAKPEPQGPTDEELDELFTDIDQGGEALSWRTYARAALARWGRLAIEPVPKQEDVHYAWELHDAEGEWQAGGSANSLEDVQREGNRYLQTYSQDGPHKLIIQQHRVTTIEPVPGVEGADA
jgi:hypothetical protein